MNFPFLHSQKTIKIGIEPKILALYSQNGGQIVNEDDFFGLHLQKRIHLGLKNLAG